MLLLILLFSGEVALGFCESLCKTHVTMHTCYAVSKVALSAPLFSNTAFHSMQIKSKRLGDLIKEIKHKKERSSRIDQVSISSSEKGSAQEKRTFSPGPQCAKATVSARSFLE